MTGTIMPDEGEQNKSHQPSEGRLQNILAPGEVAHQDIVDSAALRYCKKQASPPAITQGYLRNLPCNHPRHRVNDDESQGLRLSYPFPQLTQDDFAEHGIERLHESSHGETAQSSLVTLI